MPSKRYIPSKSIRKRISDWEGRSMYAPAPDTGRVNRSFEAEASAFNSVLPYDLRSNMSQDMLDALYSTSYNIGAGNFRDRVVPVLHRLNNGEATVEDVQNAMYGTNDKKYRGLQRRRATERSLFGEAYRRMHPNNFTPESFTVDTSIVTDPINNILVDNTIDKLPSENTTDTNILPEVTVTANKRDKIVDDINKNNELKFFASFGKPNNIFDRMMKYNPVNRFMRRRLDSNGTYSL